VAVQEPAKALVPLLCLWLLTLLLTLSIRQTPLIWIKM
jgi:hypothetical protein